MSLTCRDLIAVLGDYLDESLSLETLTALEQHLADCAPCVAYLNTYRRTRELTAEVARVPMPDEMKARLRQFLVEQLARHGS